MLKDLLSFAGEMPVAAARFHEALKDASATDPAKRLRTTNMYCSFLTLLPGEMKEAEDQEKEDESTFGLSARTASLSGRPDLA